MCDKPSLHYPESFKTMQYNMLHKGHISPQNGYTSPVKNVKSILGYLWECKITYKLVKMIPPVKMMSMNLGGGGAY